MSRESFESSDPLMDLLGPTTDDGESSLDAPEWQALRETWQNQQTGIQVEDTAFLKKLERRINFNHFWNKLVIAHNFFWLISFFFIAYYVLVKIPLVLSLPYVLGLGPILGFVAFYDYRLRSQAKTLDNKNTRSYLETAINHCEVAIKLRRYMQWVCLYTIAFVIGFGILHQQIESERFQRNNAWIAYLSLIGIYILWAVGSWRWKKHKQRERAELQRLLQSYLPENESSAPINQEG